MRSCRAIFNLFSPAPSKDSLTADISNEFKAKLIVLVSSRREKYRSLLSEERARLVIDNWDIFINRLQQNISNEWVAEFLQANPRTQKKMISNYVDCLAQATGLSNQDGKNGTYIQSTRIASQRFQYAPTKNLHYTLPEAVLSATLDISMPILKV